MRSAVPPVFHSLAGVALALGLMMGASAGCRRSPPPRTAAKPAAPAEPPPAAKTAESQVVAVDGAEVYARICAACHMADGKGVPNFQPAIVGSPILTEDPIRLETVIRAGSAVLRDRPNPMGWEMPPFGTLSDPEVKALVAYVRETFGPAAQSR